MKIQLPVTYERWLDMPPHRARLMRKGRGMSSSLFSIPV